MMETWRPDRPRNLYCILGRLSPEAAILKCLLGGSQRRKLAVLNRNESAIKQKYDHQITTGKVPVNIYDDLAGIDRI